MKELSIEEKAKRYDEVREKIALRFGSNVAEEIFSQFEMSEDERIRKEIITYLYNEFNNIKQLTPRTNEFERWIAWLERQGEEIIPLEEIILNVWELGNYWKELTKSVCNTEYGRQLDYIVKHWKEGEHYIKSFEKQDEQILANSAKNRKDAWNEEDENELAILKGYIKSGEWSTAHISRALSIIDSIINKMTEK